MTYSLTCDAGALLITGQSARRGATAFCAINTTALWFPVAPGITSLPAGPAEVVNPTPAAANQATLPPDWNDAAPDLCYLFQDILPVGVAPVFPTELTVSYVHPPFLETVEAVGIVKTKLVVSDLPYVLTLPGASVVARTRARLSVIDYSMAGDAGSLAITGQDAALREGRSMIAAAGTLAITGQDATLRAGASMAADTGSLLIAGEDVNFNSAAATYELAAEAGSLLITGQNTVDQSAVSSLLLLHMEGTGSTIVDSSSAGKTITLNTGDVQDITQSTTQKKFGSKGLYFPSGYSWLEATTFTIAGGSPGSTVGAVTFEMFFWFSSAVATDELTHILSSDGSFLSAYYLGTEQPGSTGIGLSISGGASIGTLATETWHYIKITRATNGVLRRFVNGTEYYTGTTHYSYAGVTYVHLGNEAAYDGPYSVKGYLDEVRVRSEVDNSLTVPTEAFPDP